MSRSSSNPTSFPFAFRSSTRTLLDERLTSPDGDACTKVKFRILSQQELYENVVAVVDGPLPSVLQEVTVPVIKNDICESMYRNAGYIEHIPHIFICAGHKQGSKDSCEGDSGGKLKSFASMSPQSHAFSPLRSHGDSEDRQKVPACRHHLLG